MENIIYVVLKKKTGKIIYGNPNMKLRNIWFDKQIKKEELEKKDIKI